jgi:hypothetical protein
MPVLVTHLGGCRVTAVAGVLARVRLTSPTTYVDHGSQQRRQQQQRQLRSPTQNFGGTGGGSTGCRLRRISIRRRQRRRRVAIAVNTDVGNFKLPTSADPDGVAPILAVLLAVLLAESLSRR